MAVNKEQVKQLLGSGLSSETVASAVGCEPSYISQLLGDEQFALEVTTLRSQALMANSARDSTMGSIEAKLLNRLEDLVDGNAFYKPRDVLSAVAVINRMTRRGAQAPASVHVQNTVVRLNLPTTVLAQFKTNKVGEVIEADGQTLVTMPARTLLQTLSHRAQGVDESEDRYDKARRFIPGAQ